MFYAREPIHCIHTKEAVILDHNPRSIFSIEKHKLQAEQSLERKRGVGSEMKQDLLEKYYCIFAKNKKYFHVLIFFYFKIC